MTHRPAAFAIPGDITTLTGGYIYERRLLEGLRAIGHDVRHIQLGASFPAPTAWDMDDTISKLSVLEEERVLILDGLVYGSIDTAGLARVRAPIVAMIHHPLALESGLPEKRRRHLFITERDNLALAAHVLVPSPHTAKILARDYGVEADRITIARPGTDQSSAKASPVHPPLILSVGILHPRKGHDVLLRALAEIAAHDWEALIVGHAHDAGHAAELETLRLSLGLGDRVRLTGRVAQRELEDIYAKASIFALATRYEGYGIVFDEALSHGLPIVSCNTGAVPDTVPADAGLLVPPDSPGPLAEALLIILTDADLRKRLAEASALAGDKLPSWSETALKASGVLDRVN